LFWIRSYQEREQCSDLFKRNNIHLSERTFLFKFRL
jgi:hypothetical protein